MRIEKSLIGEWRRRRWLHSPICTNKGQTSSYFLLWRVVVTLPCCSNSQCKRWEKHDPVDNYNWPFSSVCTFLWQTMQLEDLGYCQDHGQKWNQEGGWERPRRRSDRAENVSKMRKNGSKQLFRCNGMTHLVDLKEEVIRFLFDRLSFPLETHSCKCWRSRAWRGG